MVQFIRQIFCKKRNDILKIEKTVSSDSEALYNYSEELFSKKETNLQLAHERHTKAAKAGYPKAMGEEGDFIINGWVQGTLEDAFEYLIRAYESGYKMASWSLGHCFFYGWGTTRSLENARYYYKIAKRLGVGINMKDLKKMTEDEFHKVDCEKALKNHREFYN